LSEAGPYVGGLERMDRRGDAPWCRRRKCGAGLGYRPDAIASAASSSRPSLLLVRADVRLLKHHGARAGDHVLSREPGTPAHCSA
jgi:hypothetical protein